MAGAAGVARKRERDEEREGGETGRWNWKERKWIVEKE